MIIGGREFAGTIWDESQALKNPKAQRTQAAEKIVAGLPDDALVMMLTGTPVLNRPVELIPPLKMLGVISNEPGSRVTERWFKNRFCWDDATQTYNGARNLDELAKWLRATCLMRRTKQQVLTELPAKQRAPQWVQLTPESRRLFDTLAGGIVRKYLRTLKWDITDMTELRRVAGKAKASMAVEWAKDFLDTTGKSLVIFAHHQEVQNAIIDGLRAAGHDVTHILGSQKDVEEHKARFQAGQSKVIVCSLLAASTGHTLTAASDVLMVEMWWNPGINHQAEDRCHRIGQTDSVTAWYMLAEDTIIDDHVYDMVASKAADVDAINADGRAADFDERATVADIMAKLVQKYGSQKRTSES